MNQFGLPKSVIIEDVEYTFNSDYRDILQIFEILNDPDLLESERLYVAINLFYCSEIPSSIIEKAIREMFEFITMCDYSDNEPVQKSKPLYDWNKDFNIIIAPINHILNTDVRSLEYLHWWTFLSAFMEIGDSTFSTYVSIRDKLNKNKKLEKYEEQILKENRDKIILKPKVDSTTQAIMNEILGV